MTLFDEKPIYIQCFNRNYKYSANIILYIFNNNINDLKYFAGQNMCGLDGYNYYIISNHKKVILKQGDYIVRLLAGELENPNNSIFNIVLEGKREQSERHHVKSYQFLVMDKFAFDLLFYETTN